MALRRCAISLSAKYTRDALGLGNTQFLWNNRQCNTKSLTRVMSSSYFQRNYGRARLSPAEVTEIITKSEMTVELNQRSIKSFDTNQLASNTPIEDARAEARCLLTTGLLFGVFDGHGGHVCSQVIAKRLFSYIAASLLPPDVLIKFLDNNVTDPSSEGIPLLDKYNDELFLREDLQILYNRSFHDYLEYLVAQTEDEPFEMSTALMKAFNRLDNDISLEARAEDLPDPQLLLSIALAGCVATVAHIDGEHMHVASCGDCRAVLGVRTDEDGWKAKILTNEHNSANENEVARILGEHPEQEKDSIIINDRLMGQLAPLRAFGDIRFKWTKAMLKEFVEPYLREQGAPPQSVTPPYLTATPEVIYHKLRPKDAFLILGTDGLWDMMSPSEAVRLVGEHMSGKTVLSPFHLPEKEMVTLGMIHESLMKRMQSFKVKPIDRNAATHLIRHALGGTPEGLDNNRLSQFLTLSDSKARMYRDDITANVIFFDSDYLSQRPF